MMPRGDQTLIAADAGNAIFSTTNHEGSRLDLNPLCHKQTRQLQSGTGGTVLNDSLPNEGFSRLSEQASSRLP